MHPLPVFCSPFPELGEFDQQTIAQISNLKGGDHSRDTPTFQRQLRQAGEADR